MGVGFGVGVPVGFCCREGWSNICPALTFRIRAFGLGVGLALGFAVRSDELLFDDLTFSTGSGIDC